MHHTGVSNEGDVITFLNQIQYFPQLITPLGGTQHKADGLIGDTTGISIKDKRSGISKGSFDYLNTSQLPSHIAQYFTEFFEKIKLYKQTMTVEERSNPTFVKSVRTEFKSLTKIALDSLDEDAVTAFLYDALITRYESCPHIAVRDGATNKLYLYDRDSNLVVRALIGGTKFHLLGTAKGSRRIAHTSLRIRLTTNNGITALLGISDSNKSSVLVLKLQQDNVPALLKEVGPVIFSMGE